MNNYKIVCNEVLHEVNNTLLSVDKNQIDEYIAQLLKAEKVFFVGIGRVKISLEAAIKRFNHLGIQCVMVGDLTEPPISKSDLLVVASGSGESIIPLEISKKAQSFGANIFHITSNLNSSIGQIANTHLEINAPNKESETKISVQPMSTLFEQTLFLINDIVSLLIIEKNQLELEDISKNHANLE